MKTIDQMTQPEVAAMSEEDLEKYIDLELMSVGVLRPREPVLQPLPDVVVKCKDYWTIQINKGGDYGNALDLDIAFETDTEAKEFLDLCPYILKTEWGLGEGQKFVIKITPGDAKVFSCSFPERDELLKKGQQLAKLKEVRDANAREEREYQKALDQVKKVAEDVYRSWNVARDRKRFMDRLIETFSKYVEMSEGNAAIAEAFLSKAFKAEEIEEAFTIWASSTAVKPPRFDPRPVRVNGDLIEEARG